MGQILLKPMTYLERRGLRHSHFEKCTTEMYACPPPPFYVFKHACEFLNDAVIQTGNVDQPDRTTTVGGRRQRRVELWRICDERWTLTAEPPTQQRIVTYTHSITDMAMGWVDPWVGLGWVGSSSVKCELLPNSTGEYYFQSRILFNIHHSERDFSAGSRTISDVRSKLLKQWNSFVGQCVVHCLTWTTNDLI